mmetsp:Transcript_86969/g.218895  ORF Transcript_86969/g.218895 Transcript_86969/m.218895 type:complete len:151 (+) Transcript_86969:100-552(+)
MALCGVARQIGFLRPLFAQPAMRMPVRTFGDLKVPITTPVHHAQTLANPGFLSLTYPSSRMQVLKDFLENHGAKQYDFKSDNLHCSITGFAVSGKPVVELFCNEGYEEVHVQAANPTGETLIMGLLSDHRDYVAISRCQVTQPLTFPMTS